MTLEPVLIAFGAFLAAVVAGSVGFAFAIVVTSVWIYVLPPAEIVLLGSICATLLHALSAWRYRRNIDYRRLWPFIAGGALGVPVGVLALRGINPTVFRHFFGAFMIAYSAYAFARPTLRVARLPAAAARLADGVVGWVSGIMGGIALLHGALPTIWCALRGWDKRESRYVYQPYILFTGALVMVAVGLNVEVDARRVSLGLAVGLPAMAAGLWVGFRVFDWISEAHFQRLVLALLMASGIALFL